MMTREDMLRELELQPVWRERAPRAKDASTVPELAIADAAQAATPKVEVTPEPEPQIETLVTGQPDPMQPQAEAHEVEVHVELAAIETILLSDATVLIEQRSVVEVIAEEITEASDAPTFAEETNVEQARADTRVETIRSLDWESLQACVQDCTACALFSTRTQAVFGVGDPKAEWLIVGEAPGAEEDRRGEPFIGQAGKLLDNMLAAIQLRRGNNVYIANVLKCRPPENRDPQGEEVAQCELFLKRQVELIQPKLILAVGKFAAQTLLQTEDKIADLRGKVHQYNGVPVIVTYHPAYLLRNQADKPKAWEDLVLACKTMQSL